MPRVPTRIELPSIGEQAKVKQSHKDFYNQEMKEDGKEESNQSLIEAKFNEIQGTMEKVGRQREEYLRLSNQPYSKWQAIFNLE